MSVVELDHSLSNIRNRKRGLVARIYITAGQQFYKSDCMDGLLFPNISSTAGTSIHRSGDSWSARYPQLESHAGHILQETEGT